MLTPLGWLYGKIINKRNALYEKGSLKSISLGVPTISVGNITVGGTGKTPLVAYVAELLAEKSEKVCIISRGYKRENENERILVSDSKRVLANVRKAGDEPLELANKLLGKAVVVADANRVAAGLWAKQEFGITAFLLDDAFQHLKVTRDLDILTIDATNPFGNTKPLPKGILREPIENLKRADLFVITRTNLSDNIDQIKAQIKTYNQNSPIITAHNEIANLTRLEDLSLRAIEKEQETKDKYLAFCALGNPENFFNQLIRENYQIVATKKFNDHHFYTQQDVKKLENKARDLNANAIITTAKDAVKLTNLDFEVPCYIAESKMIFDDEKKLRKIIYAVFASND